MQCRPEVPHPELEYGKGALTLKTIRSDLHDGGAGAHGQPKYQWRPMQANLQQAVQSLAHSVNSIDQRLSYAWNRWFVMPQCVPIVLVLLLCDNTIRASSNRPANLIASSIDLLFTVTKLLNTLTFIRMVRRKR